MPEETTFIVGYFNPQDYEIVLNVSNPPLHQSLRPKKFLLNAAGQKINDPRLTKLLRPNGLACERSTTPLPVIALVAPDPVSSSPGFAGTSQTQSLEQQLSAKKVPGSVLAPQPGTRVPHKPIPQVVSSEFTAENSSPIRGYSMAEARRKGLVQATTRSNEGVPDTETGPPDASTIPEIKVAMDKKVRDQMRGKKASIAEHAKTSAKTHPEAQSKQHAPVPDADFGAVDVAKLTSEIISDMDRQEEGTATEDSTPEPGMDVPPPDGTEAPPAPPKTKTKPSKGTKASTKAKKPHPFGCPLCEKRFQFRSYLERHAKRTHPDQVAEALAPYPKK